MATSCVVGLGARLMRTSSRIAGPQMSRSGQGSISPSPTTQSYGSDPARTLCLVNQMGRHILFKCPQLGTNVQHWLPEASSEGEPNAYVSVVCLACTRLHFIHKETGKLLGKD